MTVRTKQKTKRIILSIVSVLLALLVIGGIAIGVTALVRYSEENSKTIKPSWSVGALDENGEYRATKGSIYTKDTFDCRGLLVTLDFDAKVSYQVYFYDDNGSFIFCTGVLTSSFDEVPLVATKARIVVTPNDDDNISWTEKSKYAEQITITVSKEQGNPIGNIVKFSFESWTTRCADFIGTPDDTVDGDYIYKTTTAIDVSGYSQIAVCQVVALNIMYGDENMENFNDGFTLLRAHDPATATRNDYKLTYIDIPEGVKYVRFCARDDYFTKFPYIVYLVK